jgi:hypothetical protein
LNFLYCCFGLAKGYIPSILKYFRDILEMFVVNANNFAAWEVKESDFPERGTTEDQLRYLLRYAILAPSGPNSQPWKFAVNINTISVYADLKRSLPFVDPTNRTLFMSVGCAIANLLVAGAHFGFSPRLDYFPKGQENDLVAEVKFERKARTASEDLFAQITRRQTTKDRYEDRKIDNSLLADLRTCIGEDEPGFHLQYMVTKDEKSALVDLMARAHHIQLSNKYFRSNLASWLRNNWTTEPDGMPLYTFGVPDAISLGFPAAFKEFDLSEAVIYRDSGLISGCGAMGVLSSDGDDKLAWAKCGRLLETYLLKAASYDIRASFFSQPIGLPQLREELMNMIKEGYPQILFGLGYSVPVKHTPRRALEDVLIEQ